MKNFEVGDLVWFSDEIPIPEIRSFSQIIAIERTKECTLFRVRSTRHGNCIFTVSRDKLELIPDKQAMLLILEQ
jgi:hypothetical protein